jgi:hypothetical protein
MGRSWRYGGLAIAIAAQCACSQVSAATGTTAPTGGGGGLSVAPAIAFRMLEHGTASAFDGTVGATHEIIAADLPSWQALYLAHHPGAPPPAVDFPREQVVGVILGRPTTGYAVALLAVSSGPTGPLVTYEEQRPGPNSVPIAQLTQPYFFAVISTGTGTVSFRHLFASL